MIDQGAEEPISFLKKYYVDELRRNPEAPNSQPFNEQEILGLYSEVPNYITNLLERREEIPDWWESEFSSDWGGEAEPQGSPPRSDPGCGS